MAHNPVTAGRTGPRPWPGHVAPPGTTAAALDALPRLRGRSRIPDDATHRTYLVPSRDHPGRHAPDPAGPAAGALHMSRP
ncbi:Hypothetical protein SCLAV_p1542 (plasmid) [Streptomyces clavuligerus]|uniref:Uncharacterized protein n=1 Tax=Streptomyces clavuligerus TaxID=1901 RepID=D5SM80_STRCL|nr:Hypothetical protein SCLAV_p1542 [Streptomyces clavuligerus]